ncbi:hypothetical protein ACVJH7_005090 [Bradyrhizobium elkanii]
MRFDVRGVDHLRVYRSTVAGKRAEQAFPYAAPRPPGEAIVDRCRRPVGFGAIGPAAAAFQHMYNAADNAAIVLPLDTAHIGWQVRFDPLPLLVAQPKQTPTHDPNPSPKENQYRIVGAEQLMSSHSSKLMILVCFMNAKFAKVVAAKSHELRIQHTSDRRGTGSYFQAASRSAKTLSINPHSSACCADMK